MIRKLWALLNRTYHIAWCSFVLSHPIKTFKGGWGRKPDAASKP